MIACGPAASALTTTLPTPGRIAMACPGDQPSTPSGDRSASRPRTSTDVTTQKIDRAVSAFDVSVAIGNPAMTTGLDASAEGAGANTPNMSVPGRVSMLAVGRARVGMIGPVVQRSVPT
ncbi:hypothetical protein GCM10010170_042520 [Dactylosporangium salmoneum]|uniref:Uncharacterized protein n=1 Tax=Dactylosporangium salmoneum TaxID=53361 RepID=A0ABP5TGF4_9ACTN